MRLFVTGATGFIGTHVVHRLSATGYRLRCLVRSSSRVDALRELGVEILTGDVTDLPALQEGMAGCDAVLHLAGLYTMWHPDRREFVRANLQGTRAVMETALSSGVQRVIHVSTAAVYGRPDERPFNEASKPGPHWFSDYGRSKAAADRVAWNCARRGLPLTSFYPGIVLGAGDTKPSGQYLCDLVLRRTPSSIYHHSMIMYIYVGDVVNAIERALIRPQSVGQKYLLGAVGLTGRQYAELVARVTGQPAPLLRLPDRLITALAHLFTAFSNRISHRPPPWGLSVDAARTLSAGFYFDGSKAESELGLSYTPIEQAIAEAAAFYRRKGTTRS